MRHYLVFGNNQAVFLTFADFAKKLNSLELLNNIFENSSPKGSFGRNKRKFEFSVLSRNSRKIESDALKLLIFRVSQTLLSTTEKTIHPMFSLRSICSCLGFLLSIVLGAPSLTFKSTSYFTRRINWLVKPF